LDFGLGHCQEAKAMKGREARERSQRLQEDEQAEYGEGALMALGFKWRYQ